MQQPRGLSSANTYHGDADAVVPEGGALDRTDASSCVQRDAAIHHA